MKQNPVQTVLLKPFFYKLQSFYTSKLNQLNSEYLFLMSQHIIQQQLTFPQIKESILRKIKIEDQINKLLSQPLQIKLRHNHVQLNAKNQQTKINNHEDHSFNNKSEGIYIVKKDCIYSNKYKVLDIKSIQIADKVKDVYKSGQANLISFMKPSQFDIQSSPESKSLAICICMYTQDKRMLRNTLKGVQDNIINLVNSGMSSDEISVIVIIDGIEKMDQSMLSFFQEIEREMDIYIDDEKKISLQNLMKQINEQDQSENNLDLKSMLFNMEELTDRRQRKFMNVYKEYKSNQQLKRFFDSLNSHIPYDSLPQRVRDIFKLLSIQEYSKIKSRKLLSDKLQQQIFQQKESKNDKQKKKYIRQKQKQLQQRYEKEKQYLVGNLSAKEQQKMKQIAAEKKLIDDCYLEKQAIDYFTADHIRYESMLMRSIHECRWYCDQYLSARDNLAYLVGYRKLIKDQDKEQVQFDQQFNSSKTELFKQSRSRQSKYFEKNKSKIYMNLFMCVKYKNSGKLSSHHWFFNGFCKQLSPRYSILLDVGLKPHSDALYKMVHFLHSDKMVGGVCGYMSLKIEDVDKNQIGKVDWLSNIALKFVDIQRTQQLEYHFSHLIDKGFEASFNFIHVLPGAFSAYNMSVLNQLDKDRNTIFKQYFKSIDQKLQSNKIIPTNHSAFDIILRILLPNFLYECLKPINPDSEESMIYNQNINLAEDRILCMGIHKNGKNMAYLPDAFAEVDPMKTLNGLLGQRKRWINGSFFAFDKVKSELSAHEQDTNKFQICLSLQILYLSFMNMLSYFAPSLFLFTVHIAMQAFRADVLPNVLQNVILDANTSAFYNFFVYTIDFIYVVLILSCVFLSLHLSHTQPKFVKFIYLASTIFGIFQIIVFVVLIVDLVRSVTTTEATFLQQNLALVETLPGGNTIINFLRGLIIASMGIYILPIFTYVICFQRYDFICDILLGFFSFIFYSPTYLNILNIYALCRIDDISWGTKGLDTSINSKHNHLKDSWKILKYIHVFKFVFWNIIVGILLLSFGSNYYSRFFITLGIVAILSLTLIIKIICAVFYFIGYRCCKNIQLESGYSQSRIDNYLSSIQEQFKANVAQNIQEVYQAYNKSNKKYAALNTGSQMNYMASMMIFNKKKKTQQSKIISKRSERQKPLFRSEDLNNLTTKKQQKEKKWKKDTKKQAKDPKSYGELNLIREEENDDF